MNWAGNYPATVRVVVTLPALGVLPEESFTDEVAGLNAGHALWRARRNWPDADVSPLPA